MEGRASYVVRGKTALQPVASKPEQIPALQRPEAPQLPGPANKDGALPLGLLSSDMVATLNLWEVIFILPARGLGPQR